MKTIFVIGILVASATAYSEYAPNKENPLRIVVDSPYGPRLNLTDILKQLFEGSKTTKTAYILSDKETLIKDIKKFGRQLFSDSLNLKNFICRYCFPFQLDQFDVANLQAIVSVLKEIYGSEYDRLLQEPSNFTIFDVDVVPEKDVAGDLRTILGKWSKILAGLENKTISWDWVKEELPSQKELLTIFFATVDREKLRQSQWDFYSIFTPVIIESITDRNLARAVASYRNSLEDSIHLAESPYEKAELEEKIHSFIRRLYNSIFDLDPQGKDYMTANLPKLLNEMSKQTLTIFYSYLENDFGESMKKIPEKPLTTAEERREKLEIASTLKQKMDSTLRVWKNEFSHRLESKYTNSWEDSGYQKQFETYADHLVEFLSVEELRTALTKATPLLDIARNRRPTPSIKN